MSRYSLLVKFFLLTAAMFVVLFGLFAFYLQSEFTNSILNDARLNASNGLNHEAAGNLTAGDFSHPSSPSAVAGFEEIFRDLESRGFLRIQVVNNVQKLLSDSRMTLTVGEVMPLTKSLSKALTGQSFYEKDDSGPYGRHIDFYLPYALSFADGDVTGVVIATMSSSAIEAASLFRLERIYLLLGLGLAMLLLVIALYFRILVIKPLENLGAASLSVGKGNFQTEIPKNDDRDEIGLLSKQFDVMRQNLANLDEAKSSFVSIAAHQLKTPLTSIRWMTELMASGESGPLNDEQKEYAAQIHGGVLRLIDTMDLFLALTRIEQGRMKIAPEPTDLSELANSVVKEMAPLAAEKGLKVTVAAPAASVVVLDKLIARQVIANILSNSIRYSQKGGRVEVLVESAPGEFKLMIKDDGIGIPEAARSNIFEKFFRADNAKAAVDDGNGLGLTLVKKLVEGWGGKIWFESPVVWKNEDGVDEMKGTAFHFTVPARAGVPK